LPVPDFCLFPFVFFRNKARVKILLFSLILLLLVLPVKLNAQWVNNPSENTKVVYDLTEPINISAVSDRKGGAFIFWEDNVTGLQNTISFMHIESSGNISFRADGKKISETAGNQDNPVAAPAGENYAVVAWKDYSVNKTGNLLVQKVQANGNILWNPKGVRINRLNKEISDYSLCANEQGEVFICYLAKEPGQALNSKVMLQKISSSGKFLFDSLGITVTASAKGKMFPYVLPDNLSGTYIFWIETPGSKGTILSKHYHKTGRSLWGKQPVSITDNSLNVISFAADRSESDIYIAYQVLKNDKSIYHQLINYNGKLLWGRNGKVCSTEESIQSNPQMISAGSSLILSWTNEVNYDRDIHIQKYDRNGKPLWQTSGIPVIKMKGDQFGQKIISDDKNGAIIAWLDRRMASATGNIYSQRITAEGEICWNAGGIAIGSFFNTPKSYLNLLPDGRGGAIAVFKEKRNGTNGIYVQKIFNTGTFVSQIIGFRTEVASNSVKIAWYSANEFPESRYDIERSVQTDTGNTDWQKLTTINADSRNTANYYQYIDKPDTSGTLYYRVVLNDNYGNTQSSEVSRVTFLESTDYIIVTQNNPNPFSDSTQIKFYLPEQADVKIEFFNNHIEKIDEICNRFPAGKNSVTFFAQNRWPGIYFYRFASGNYIEVKKMVLTR
jgi:hypothetical protein